MCHIDTKDFSRSDEPSSNQVTEHYWSYSNYAVRLYSVPAAQLSHYTKWAYVLTIDWAKLNLSVLRSNRM
uniref:Uncharacterized protein n=1 Tax=Anopheles funestus TaxID=62324 RepID=A0A182S198_ANOFN